MGCDIHAYAERRAGGEWHVVDASHPPFDWRDYGLYAFLAGVRNYSEVEPIAVPRGLPGDISEHVRREFDLWAGDAHTPGWLSVSELAAFDYDANMEDRRIRTPIFGLPGLFSTTGKAAEGEGVKKTWREFLGEAYFADLEKLTRMAERVVFWFDN